VLYRAGREIAVAEGALSLGLDKFPAALANTGKTVGLNNSKGIPIDEVTYPGATRGKSYERSDDGTWHICSDEKGGTPGAANSPGAGSGSGSGEDPGSGTDPAVPPVDDSRPGDIIINEVMADPVGLTALPEVEYVEIYNASGRDISLFDWIFLYDGKETFLPDAVLPAGGYAVLYRSGREMTVAAGALSLGLDKFPSALANTGKTVGLNNSAGILIDEVTYPGATRGKSYERGNNGAWHVCSDEKGGTPGAANSPDTGSGSGSGSGDDPGSGTDPAVPPVDNSRPGDIIINEVMADPVGLTALAETEYVEIYNTSGQGISLYGWNFIYDGKETALPNAVLPAGGYAVLYRSGREMAVAAGALSLGLDKFPAALANTGKTVGLNNSKGIPIDEVAYPGATRGKSYERGNNSTWHVCSDEKGGTPGAANSPGAGSGSGTDPAVPPVDDSRPGDILINEVMADPVGLTALPETEYVEIYNTSGQGISLYGWNFIYDGKETALPDAVLPSGGYAVLYRSGREMAVAAGALSLELDKFPSALANTGKTVGLNNSEGIPVDEVAYPGATRGKSYERGDEGAWHVCTDEKGGTPGEANSPALLPEPDPDPGTDPAPPDPVDPSPDDSEYGDIIINEVMADPVGLTALPETEYVEIYNASGSDFSLSGWHFVYDGKETALPDITLPGEGYAVLYRSGHDIIVAAGALSLGLDKFPSALANTGKTVGLKNSKDILIDEIACPGATKGKSCERDGNDGWHVCTDEKGGTPGAANSPGPGSAPGTDPGSQVPGDGITVEPLDVIINEILPEPFAGGSEYIELYNRSGRSLFLPGLAIAVRRADGTLSTHYPLDAVSGAILPEGYAVLTKSYNGVADFYMTSSPENIYEVKLPVLNNEGAAIVLFRMSDETVIDEVSYAAGWHDASIKDKKGVSLERIHPDESNWTSATAEAGYGTPGCRNSQYRNGDSGRNMFIDPPEYVPGSDYYMLAYYTDKPGYRCRVEVYATSGKKIAEISNNQLTAQDGELKWDGRGPDNSRLSPGVYIFYAEFYHADGDHHKFEKAFLVK
jgi:TM2 domain-containing membrane protein YozV